MAKVEVYINMDGIRELRNSQEVQDMLYQKANEIAARCSGSYETDVRPGKTRANASIITRDYRTYGKNLKDNELLKALR